MGTQIELVDKSENELTNGEKKCRKCGIIKTQDNSPKARSLLCRSCYNESRRNKPKVNKQSSVFESVMIDTKSAPVITEVAPGLAGVAENKEREYLIKLEMTLNDLVLDIRHVLND